MDQKHIEYGKFFREAWIAGLKHHYPEAPERYVKPWSDMDQWEQESASAVFEQVRQFVEVTQGRTTYLSREQKGRFISVCWIGQIFTHFASPKASYVADWDQLPTWQQETDADIFEAIERLVLQEVA